jgi:hypothetical protein
MLVILNVHRTLTGGDRSGCLHRVPLSSESLTCAALISYITSGCADVSQEVCHYHCGKKLGIVCSGTSLIIPKYYAHGPNHAVNCVYNWGPCLTHALYTHTL